MNSNICETQDTFTAFFHQVRVNNEQVVLQKPNNCISISADGDAIECPQQWIHSLPKRERQKLSSRTQSKAGRQSVRVTDSMTFFFKQHRNSKIIFKKSSHYSSQVFDKRIIVRKCICTQCEGTMSVSVIVTGGGESKITNYEGVKWCRISCGWVLPNTFTPRHLRKWTICCILSKVSTCICFADRWDYYAS